MISLSFTRGKLPQILLNIAAISTCVVLQTGCTQQPENRNNEVVQLIEAVGCSSCHEIPGVDSADARVGPPLHEYHKRTYIAGLLPNNHSNLVQWLMEPSAIHKRTAMPDVGLSTVEAAAIARYLRHE